MFQPKSCRKKSAASLSAYRLSRPFPTKTGQCANTSGSRALRFDKTFAGWLRRRGTFHGFTLSCGTRPFTLSRSGHKKKNLSAGLAPRDSGPWHCGPTSGHLQWEKAELVGPKECLKETHGEGEPRKPRRPAAVSSMQLLARVFF